MKLHSIGGVIVIQALLLASPWRLDAQQFPAFGGADVRLGVAAPSDASAGLSAGADLDLGYIGIASLRTIAGLHYFAADRDVAGEQDPGSYTATGGRLGVRLDLFGTQRFSPFVLAAITGHRVSADVPDSGTRDLLEGFYVGASVGAGAAYSLDQEGQFAVIAEARRTTASNIAHYAFELGVRLQPRGRESYFRAPDDPRARAEAARLAVERERLLVEEERREEERLAAERARTEQERLAGVAEEERRRSGEQVQRAEQEVEAARGQAAAAEQARQAEMEARERAEIAAAEAAEREAAAARTAREAEARAAEAERRLYASLLDLDRLIANVTEIRETERGLAVVVGEGLFATGQSSLSAPARAEVGRIAAVLNQFSEQRISVEGHTDAVGSEVSNQALSEQRGESVRAALIAEGIDPSRVTAVGYGESRPIAGNETAADRARNRRVEIVILGARRPATQ